MFVDLVEVEVDEAEGVFFLGGVGGRLPFFLLGGRSDGGRTLRLCLFRRDCLVVLVEFLTFVSIVIGLFPVSKK